MASCLPLLMLGSVTFILQVHGQSDLMVDVGYLATNRADEDFAKDNVAEYFTKVIDVFIPQQSRSRQIQFNLTVINTSNIERSTVANLNQKVACFLGEYNEYFSPAGYLRPREVPYIVTGNSGFMNIVWKDEGNTIKCARKGDEYDDVISFYPPLNSLTRMLDEACPDPFKRGVVIAESSGDIHDILKATNRAGNPCYDLATFVMEKYTEKLLIMRMLRSALKLRPYVIFLYSFNLEYITKIFQAAHEANMLTYQHYWVLSYPDIEGIPDELDSLFRRAYANVTGFNMIHRENFKKFGIVPPSGEILKYAGLLDVMIKLAEAVKTNIDQRVQRLGSVEFNNHIKGLKYQEQDTVGMLNDCVAEHPDIGTGAFCRGSYRTVYYSYEGGILHKFRDNLQDDSIGCTQPPDRSGLTTPVPKLNREDILSESELGNKFKFWRSPPEMPLFYNNVARVVAMITEPMMISEAGKYSGMMVDYLEKCSEILNFTIEITRVVNNREDMIDALSSGYYDIGIGSIGMSGAAEREVDFTDTIRLGRVTMMTKKPRIKVSTWQFLEPFTWTVWVSLGVVFIVVSILLTLMDILDWTDASFPVRDSFYYTAGLLCGGSTDTTPATVPSRLMVCCLMFFAIVISNSYTANMTAFLTMRKGQTFPRTLQQLAAQSGYNYSFIKGSEINYILGGNPQDPYGAIVNRMRTKGIKAIPTIDEGIEQVKSGNLILITEEFVARYQSNLHCYLDIIIQPSRRIHYAMMLPLGAPYRVNLNTAIMDLRESKRDTLFRRYWDEFSAKCDYDDQIGDNSNTRRLKWGEMVGVFYVLLMGAGLAIIVGIIGEIKVRCIKKEGRKRTPWKDFRNACRHEVVKMRSLLCPWRRKGEKADPQEELNSLPT